MTNQLKLQGPISGAPVIPFAQYDPGASGYVVEEYFVTGAATSYSLIGARGDDGRWNARPEKATPFTTRLVTCRPADRARFNGTVVVEWLNVSGGLDAPPDWYMMHRHMMREGMAWVGVSAQRAGVEGGAALGAGIPLKQANKARYESLSHPGDAFALDIFTQAGQAVRMPANGGILGPLAARHLIAVGASQSAIFLVTYINAVDPLVRTYDAFMVHGRGGIGVPIDGDFLGSRRNINIAGDGPLFSGAERIREDVRVPVLTIQSETDQIRLGGIGARQPDTERIRLWEVTGAAHFDAYGLIASQLDDGNLPAARLAELNAPISQIMGMPTQAPINAGPQFHYVSQAALAALERWIKSGEAAPRANRMELAATTPARLALDQHGIVKGGIRTPWVDAPCAILSGLGQDGGTFGFLFGTTRPFDDAKLAALYPGGRREYLARFDAAAEAAVGAGFLLGADLAEIKALGAAACPLR
jgi:hypothetical protein